MLDVEAALARAQAAAGVIAAEHADAIAAACRAERYDVDALGAAGGRRWATRRRRWCARCAREVGGPAAADVHRGATSQDVVDSAAMLVARRALEPLLDDLRRRGRRGGAAGGRAPRDGDGRAHAAAAGASR